MKSHLRFISLLSIALILTVSAIGIQPAQPAGATGNIIYVNDDANGTFDGTSWSNAYKKLQNALDVAVSGDQLWVAQGVYFPDEGQIQTNNSRSETFQLKNGVAIYGGFDGTETLLSQRDPAVNFTILSGDIDQNDTNTDGNNIAESVTDIQGNNAYNVVSNTSTLTVVDSTAILDGFVITAGKADGSPLQSTTIGGGVRLLNGNSPTLANLTIRGNDALANGGGMFNGGNSNPALTGVTFIGNNANNGGGMYNDDSNPSLTVATFDGNSADHGGGMVNATGSSPVLTNVIFNGNSAIGDGGGMTVSSNSAPSLTNVIFSGNSAGVGGGMYLGVLGNPGLTNVTFSGNSADYGGGIYILGNLVSGPAYITALNSTFSNNDATLYGGGVYSYFGDLLLINVTFSGNSAGTAGGGLYNTNTTATNFENTLIGNSTGGDCVNVSGSGTSGWYSLIEDSVNACGLTNGATGNIIGLDPNMGSLQNNGGFTETHALLNGSPAIGTGDNSSCPATDQRGITRPNGSRCDIGAFEAITTPQLASPTNGEVLHTIRPSFDWENLAGAISYQIQISRNSTFTQLVTNANLNGATSSNYATTRNLTANATHYWRVRAKVTATTYSEWSEVRSFLTGNPPGTPLLTAPVNNALVTATPLFDWNNSSLPAGTTFDKYQIQVSTSNTFGTTAIDAFTTPTDITDSDYMPGPGILTAGTTYYWRVRSLNTAGDYSAWSVSRIVRVKYNPPINLNATSSLRPTFTWDVVIGATSYSIQVSRNNTFTQLVISKMVTVPTFTATINLSAGTTYYWRVRSNGPNGPSDWSTFETFTTP